MRKAAVMIGFGAFFLTMALLMRFYAYPKLAVIPSDQNTQQTVTDDHASYFDADTVKPGSGKIITKATVVANKEMTKKASKELGRDVIVIDQWQTTDNVNDKGQTAPPPMDASTQQYAVDKSSGEAVKWSGNMLDGKPTNYEGQTIKFPFQVDKNKTYRYWDSTLGKAFPMKYAGSEDIKGLKTYKFTQTIPKTKFTTMDVPGEVFGLPKGSKLADRYYTNDRTVWVEPETGVMMKLQEKQHQTLEVPNAKPVDAMLTTSTMTDETIKKNVDDYKTKSSQLKILRLWAPLLLGLLGLFALLLGLLVSLRAGRERRAARHERRDEREVDDVRHDDDSTLVFGDHPQSRGAHSADERGQY
ncbi:hypothetical protein HX89_07995 [Dermacoccus nishinomiyaensis]|uniref:DUF3068 domain-containing protein n=1 Tax=Dermacoccus nishinomiyaensis TaxID=1274 RepID=A0A075JGG8_9MICO|nr:DUF3068 domain-containing protein [Dermacoccus nishinomiyaensis]AIF40895.1 hypothetical protein HX89_07995 [Dermacoccus nishinomiyaensis]